MDIKDLGQLKEMQKRLLKKQCDLDIQKAMVKAFIKKEESKKLTLTDVLKSDSELLFCGLENINDCEFTERNEHVCKNVRKCPYAK